MYAIIAAGGRQYRVKQGDVISVNRLAGKEGEGISFKDVLAAGDGGDIRFGSPYLKNAEVKAEIVGHLRGTKVIAFKIKRRKGYRKTKGHRSELTKVKITGIDVK